MYLHHKDYNRFLQPHYFHHHFELSPGLVPNFGSAPTLLGPIFRDLLRHFNLWIVSEELIDHLTPIALLVQSD